MTIYQRALLFSLFLWTSLPIVAETKFNPLFTPDEASITTSDVKRSIYNELLIPLLAMEQTMLLLPQKNTLYVFWTGGSSSQHYHCIYPENLDCTLVPLDKRKINGKDRYTGSINLPSLQKIGIEYRIKIIDDSARCKSDSYKEKHCYDERSFKFSSETKHFPQNIEDLVHLFHKTIRSKDSNDRKWLFEMYQQIMIRIHEHDETLAPDIQLLLEQALY